MSTDDLIATLESEAAAYKIKWQNAMAQNRTLKHKLKEAQHEIKELRK